MVRQPFHDGGLFKEMVGGWVDAWAGGGRVGGVIGCWG